MKTRLQTTTKSAHEWHVYAWARFSRIYPALNDHVMPKLIFSNRLTKTAAYCLEDDFTITLANKFLVRYPTNMCKVIIPHEIAHAINYLLFPDFAKSTQHGHDAMWCDIMKRYGLPPDRYHTMML